MLLFFCKKNQNLLDTLYTRTMYLQTGEKTKGAETFIWCLLLNFLSCIPGSFDTVTSLCMGLHRERAAVGLRGQAG